MNEENQARCFLQFNRVEGDIGCNAHIYNLGVVEGIKALPFKLSLTY